MKTTPALSQRIGRPLSAGLIVAVSITLFINIFALVYQFRIIRRGTEPYSFIGDDRPRELPIKVRTVNMAFHDDPEHYALSGMQAWADWNAIRPPGKGFVFLGDAHLPYGVAMWHQLHCLNHIRAALINGDDGSSHTEHCFHYIRQGMLCAADTTLEPGGTSMELPNGEHVAPTLNVTHSCRDWRQVHDYLEEEHKKWTPEMEARMRESSRLAESGNHGGKHGGMGMHHGM